ncbi:histidine phosphatase superfamily [Mycena alexandri]|uniref:Histidine phosphatase superfamily n=1 Tax=Mycena alexandri TaxID=1745969 RepID=A0AAD6WTC9_9AGAR|nr:histidine phosphatase superfamily [Mycena alexandri]
MIQLRLEHLCLLPEMSDILGAIIIARNGDRLTYYQDPVTYAPSLTDSTALGVTDLHFLGTQLRSEYLTPGSASFISSISGDVADTQQVNVLVKGGGEGHVVFDSAIALLQGLYPPNPKNKLTLANGEVVTAPLGGYQYIPLETVESGDWTDCPAFQRHIASFYSSDAFKTKAKDAAGFFQNVEPYIFGRPATLENIWNIYDFMNTQFTYNKTYADSLPPTYLNQARALADFHESGVYSDTHANEIGNIAGRTLLHPVLDAVERVALNDDPLKLMLVQTTYQPFISLFHQTEMTDEHPELAAIPNFGSALAIELRRGAPPDTRDFLRFKFQNGTSDADGWRILHAFGRRGDIPLTEFVYRIEGAAITSSKQWAEVCSVVDLTLSGIQVAGKTSVRRWVQPFGHHAEFASRAEGAKVASNEQWVRMTARNTSVQLTLCVILVVVVSGIVRAFRARRAHTQYFHVLQGESDQTRGEAQMDK